MRECVNASSILYIKRFNALTHQLKDFRGDLMSRKIANNILELVGSTPMVKFNKVVEDGMATVYGKLECFNPAGSVKDKAQTIEKGIDPDQYVPAGSQLVTAAIDADARLFLYQGSASNISSRPTPVRFFEARSEHYKRKGSAEESNTYVMLANLQGRNLLQ